MRGMFTAGVMDVLMENGVVQADIAPQVIRSPLEAPSLQRIREFMGVR